MVTLGHVHLLALATANVQGRVQEQSKHIWNLPAPHTVPPTSRHLQLRALPLQAVTGLPRKDKAEVVSPTDLVLWLAPHFCSVQRTQSCLSHPCRGSPGFGPSLFSTQKPSWLQKTSPEGFKVLSNYWILSCNYQHTSRDPAKAQFLGITGLYWKYPNSSQVLAPSVAHYSFSGIHSHISQHRTSTFLRMRDRYCSALSEQLFTLLSLTNFWWVKDRSKADANYFPKDQLEPSKLCPLSHLYLSHRYIKTA